MVKEMFHVEPDLWQRDALEAFAAGDRERQRISMQACAGPGKSAVLAWIAWNFLLCYNSPGEHPKGAAVSMTHSNLIDNLWAEIYKWMDRNDFLKQNFKWTQERVFAVDHKETWFLSARSFSKTANKEERGRTLSGLHAKYVLFLIDEGGSVPPEVGKAAEQALSNCEFGKICMAGNPTSHTGLLYTAHKDPSWFKIRINGDPDDPKRSPRIDIEWARKMIEAEGRNDPWVQSMILGMFPDAAISTLLTDTHIDDAVARNYHDEESKYAEKRLGVDVARFGDDSSVIFPRQGLQTYKYRMIRKANSRTVGDNVIGSVDRWGDIDKINIDGTGGYGSGVYDYLESAKIPGIFEINFSSSASQPTQFVNKRAEMYWNMAEWIKKKGSLIQCPQLRKELTATQYFFVGNKIKIETKDQIKARLGFSPDIADALALTFAQPDQNKVAQDVSHAYQRPGSMTGMVKSETYQPFKKSNYSPFKK